MRRILLKNAKVDAALRPQAEIAANLAERQDDPCRLQRAVFWIVGLRGGSLYHTEREFAVVSAIYVGSKNRATMKENAGKAKRKKPRQ